MEIQRESKPPKLKYPDGVVSLIHVRNLDHARRRSSLFDPYASDSSGSPSPLLKYLRSAESKSVSSPSFVTPLKFEEDVFVMDGIPVKKSSKGSGEPRKRSPMISSSSFNSNYSGGRSNSTPSKSYRGGGIENIQPHKNRLCSFWETCGTCQFGSECQATFDPTFAHGKKELQRPPRSSGKILPEIFKSNNNLEGSASPSCGKNCSANIQAKSSSSPSSATEEKAISLPYHQQLWRSPHRRLFKSSTFLEGQFPAAHSQMVTRADRIGLLRTMGLRSLCLSPREKVTLKKI